MEIGKDNRASLPGKPVVKHESALFSAVTFLGLISALVLASYVTWESYLRHLCLRFLDREHPSRAAFRSKTNAHKVLRAVPTTWHLDGC